MKFQTLSFVRRALIVGLSCAWVLLPVGPALAAKKAPTETHDYTERLVTEFTPLVGSREGTEALVSSLRSGRPTSSRDATDAVSVISPLSYGETRFALKLAQGRLAQEGVNQPSTDQLQAALYGGTLDSVNGPKVLAGVLPQHARGVSWGNLAQDVGMTVEDLIPPASVAAKKTARHTSVKGKKSSKKTSKKTTKQTTKKATKKTGKTSSQPGKAKSSKKTTKR